MALVFKIRLIRKNDINENWSTTQSMSTGSEGCLVVIISKVFYVHFILLTLEVFTQGAIHCIYMHYFSPYQAIGTNQSWVAGKTQFLIHQYLPNKHHTGSEQRSG